MSNIIIHLTRMATLKEDLKDQSKDFNLSASPEDNPPVNTHLLTDRLTLNGSYNDDHYRYQRNIENLKEMLEQAEDELKLLENNQLPWDIKNSLRKNLYMDPEDEDSFSDTDIICYAYVFNNKYNSINELSKLDQLIVNFFIDNMDVNITFKEIEKLTSLPLDISKIIGQYTSKIEFEPHIKTRVISTRYYMCTDVNDNQNVIYLYDYYVI